MANQRSTQEFREPLPRHEHRYESPVPRRVSAFRPIDTNLQDRSPFHRFIEDQLQELPQTNTRVTRNLEPPQLIVYQTPDRQLHHVVGFGINERLSFDLLSPNPRSYDVDNANDVIESSDQEDDDGVSVSQPAQSSSAGPQRAQNDLPQKTPVKEANGHHLSRQKTQARESATQQPKHNICCNCKKSRCLKLYCDCFRSNQVCQGCNCVSCLNTHEHQQERYSAMLAILQINEEAFKPKILVEKHAKGCNCKKSGCLKKYCECYQAGLKCSELCKCQDCKNAKTRQQRDPPKSRQRGTVKKESRYDSHTKKLIS